MSNKTNKVEYFGKVLIDLTEDSITPNKLLLGETAHDKTGSEIVGTIPSQNGETFTPSNTEQVIVHGGTYVTSDMKIAPIPSKYESWTFTLADGSTVTKLVEPMPSNVETWTLTTNDSDTITREIEVVQ